MTFVLTEESKLAPARQNTDTTPKILLELQKSSTIFSIETNLFAKIKNSECWLSFFGCG